MFAPLHFYIGSVTIRAKEVTDMKSVLLNVLKVIWTILRVIFVIVGTLGSIAAGLFFLLCIGGLLLYALATGWESAIDLCTPSILASLGIFIGFIIIRALGTFQPE